MLLLQGLIKMEKIMKKEVFLIFGTFLIIILLSFFVSGVCCERLPDDGHWCQEADSVGECDTDNYRYEEDLEDCDAVGYCQGTCISKTTGRCSSPSGEGQCNEEGNVWNPDKNQKNIPDCQEGCCIQGEDAFLMTSTECDYLEYLHPDIGSDFRSDITTEDACDELEEGIKVGACRISSRTETTCRILTEKECDEKYSDNLSEYLKEEARIGEIETDFFEDKLCTAPIVNAGCLPSETTKCENGKIYFTDSCGNLANIYYRERFPVDDADSREYWTDMKKPYDEDVCTVGSEGSEDCGNCDKYQNTVCRNENEVSGLNAPIGNYVCGELTCKYWDPIEKEYIDYEHGDAWCVGVGKGALVGIEQEEGSLGITEESRDKLKNQDRYNTPGTKYIRLKCDYGEISIEECSDYRNEICVEYSQEDENGNEHFGASCIRNTWIQCTQFTTRTQCEDPNFLCKWVPGYRGDFEIVPEDERKEKQGTCVPLIAPGFDFWEGNSDGNLLCGVMGVQVPTLFETPWTMRREVFAEDGDEKLQANRCIDNCFAIPYYGKEFNQDLNEEKMYPEEIECIDEGSGHVDVRIGGECTDYDALTEFYDESEAQLSQRVDKYYLSDRRGHYCHKDGKEDQWLTGQIAGRAYDCTPGTGSESKDEDKERDYPIFLTNDEWLASITERARSMGDCGFKPNNLGDYSDPTSEIITAMFEKLSQKLESKKELIAKQIIYKGDSEATDTHLLRYIPDGEPIEIPVEVEKHTCGEDGESTCVIESELTEGEEICETAEGTCPHGLICCKLSMPGEEEGGEE